MTITSKIAPKRAPGGTAFHQGRIAASEMALPRIATSFLHGWQPGPTLKSAKSVGIIHIRPNPELMKDAEIMQ